MLAAFILSACMPGETAADRPQAACSAAVEVPATESRGLPRAVSAMRSQLVRAATACDYELLEGLARPDLGRFVYAPGGRAGSRPATFWRDQEAAGEPALGMLVRLFGSGYAVDERHAETIYVWPAAAGPSPSEGDWQALERLYADDTDVEQWRTAGSYTGYRLGIAENGEWRFFLTD